LAAEPWPRKIRGSIPKECNQREGPAQLGPPWDLGSVSAVIAGDDERSAAALPLRSQHGFGDRVRSSQSYGTGT
jgi:hypothetical protein